VTLKSTVSTVVVTTLVLEGWSRELDPDLHIMDTLRDMLAVDWKERLSRAVDKVGGEQLPAGRRGEGGAGGSGMGE
jgi:aarF domain-containing kinase